MHDQLDKKLCEKYPRIFINRYEDMTLTAMCWGFEHGDGWYDILDALCRKIQTHIDWKQKQRNLALTYNDAYKLAKNGDTTALTEYFSNGSKKNGDWVKQMVERSLESGEREVPEECPQVIAAQVKEKFGTLRFYYDGGDEYVSGLVSMAEWASANICETCGERGKLRGQTWLYTACDKHTKENDLITENDDGTEKLDN